MKYAGNLYTFVCRRLATRIEAGIKTRYVRESPEGRLSQQKLLDEIVVSLFHRMLTAPSHQTNIEHTADECPPELFYLPQKQPHGWRNIIASRTAPVTFQSTALL